MMGKIDLNLNMKDDELDEIKQSMLMPDEIKKEIVDIYNYLVNEKASGLTVRFDDGMKIHIKLDMSEYLKEGSRPTD